MNRGSGSTALRFAHAPAHAGHRPLTAAATARLHMELNGTVDLRPIGSVDLSGLRVGDDFRWLAYVATSRQLGEYGSARTGDRAWLRTPSLGWRSVPASSVSADTLDVQALSAALTPEYRATAVVFATRNPPPLV